MALLMPGFVPSPLGEHTDYAPSIVEVLVCIGVWSIGMLVFTLMVRVGIALQRGTLRTRALLQEAA